MGCLFAMLAGLFPRFAVVVFWILRPNRFDAAFDTWIVPLLGVAFLPLATLMYVILWEPGGLTGWEWFWVAIAGVLDVTHWTASAARRNELVPVRSGP
ncbi:MAG TPA: hypothetical protein VFE86_09545 [Ilumatobacteraceae bacterium]|nr:hypothetical protein [Ilumatobacteraceae bacterium]